MFKLCTAYTAVCIWALLMLMDSAMARSISIQPRLEMGVMQYEFESEAFSRTITAVYNKTFSAFDYEDVMPFTAAGVTVFKDRVFLDISGQYAFDGNDSGSMTRSMFAVDSFDQENNFFPSSYMAFSPQNEVTFDRRDIAVSLGYSLTDNLSIFAGYKMAETQFFEKYDGLYSIIEYDKDTSAEDVDYMGGRWWGVGTYKFEYSGPFIGFIQGWDFTEAGFLKGMLTANVALAFLEGKLTTSSDVSNASFIWLDDQQIPETLLSGDGSNLSSRNNTKGDALGLKVSLSWNGVTPWERLSYNVGISSYRYEFDSNSIQTNMNESAINFKIGLSYVF